MITVQYFPNAKEPVEYTAYFGTVELMPYEKPYGKTYKNYLRKQQLKHCYEYEFEDDTIQRTYKKYTIELYHNDKVQIIHIKQPKLFDIKTWKEVCSYFGCPYELCIWTDEEREILTEAYSFANVLTRRINDVIKSKKKKRKQEYKLFSYNEFKTELLTDY